MTEEKLPKDASAGLSLSSKCWAGNCISFTKSVPIQSVGGGSKWVDFEKRHGEGRLPTGLSHLVYYKNSHLMSQDVWKMFSQRSTQSLNYEGVCRTATDTPGLLNTKTLVQ